MDEIQLLLQGIAIPEPPLAAAERLPEPLEPQPLPPVPAPRPAPTAPLTSSVAEDPELVVIRKVEKTPSNGNYKKQTNVLVHTLFFILYKNKITSLVILFFSAKNNSLVKEALQNEVEAARAQGLPSPQKVKLVYTCKKCGQPPEQRHWGFPILRTNLQLKRGGTDTKSPVAQTKDPGRKSQEKQFVNSCK